MATNHWRFLRDCDQQESLKSPVALYFRDAILLSYVLTCLYHQNEVGEYYGLRVPLLEDYVHPQTMVALHAITTRSAGAPCVTVRLAPEPLVKQMEKTSEQPLGT